MRKGKHVARLIKIVAVFLLGNSNALFALDASRQAEIIHLIKQDCGSCHGMTLKGGLGPALTKERIEHTPNNALFSAIKFGRPGTPMPPWESFLTDGEIQWVVEQLKKGVTP